MVRKARVLYPDRIVNVTGVTLSRGGRVPEGDRLFYSVTLMDWIKTFVQRSDQNC